MTSNHLKGLIVLLTGFSLLTLYISATAESNIVIQAQEMLSNVSSLQFHVFVDIYILAILFCFWLAKDCDRIGIPTSTKVFFIVLSLSLISIGVIAYLIYRYFQLQKGEGISDLKNRSVRWGRSR